MKLLEQAHTETLVDNLNCTVELSEGERLHCITTGKFLTLLLFGLGMVMIYASIVIIGWYLPEGKFHGPSMLIGTGVFLTGILFQWRCLRRKKEMGAFVVDCSNQLIRKHGVPIGMPFGEVSRVRTSINYPGLFRKSFFPVFPRWLFIEFKDGRRIRIAMGKRQELEPIVNWLNESVIADSKRR